MKMSVSARQTDMARAMADELVFEYRDVDALYDIGEKYPNKEYVVRVKRDDDADWEKLNVFSSRLSLTLALDDISLHANAPGIPFYWLYPATNWDELRALADYGVSQIYIGSPLTFELPAIKELNIPLRMTANYCYNSVLPLWDGVNGSYIRPEDLETYGKYIDTIDFITDKLVKEETLLKIYKSGHWSDDLNILLTNFGTSVYNPAIPPEVAEMRVNCRHVCMRNPNRCHYCFNSIKLINLIQKRMDEEKNDKE